MADDVRQIEREDDEIQEEWLRETDEPGVLNVSANRWDAIGGWQVAVWAMQFVRSDPLETDLRQGITSALHAVSGVTSAEEQDREQWFVTGSPSGRALVEAAARVVDDHAERIRAIVSPRSE